MKISHSTNWISADVKARIKVELEEVRVITIINIKMQRNPALDSSKTYNINMSTFKNGQPEEFLTLLNIPLLHSMEQELCQWQYILTIYVQCYVGGI